MCAHGTQSLLALTWYERGVPSAGKFQDNRVLEKGVRKHAERNTMSLVDLTIPNL